MTTESFPREFPGVNYYGPEEEAAVLRVLRKKTPFRFYGIQTPEEVDGLEKEFARWAQVPYAHAVSSGTNALCTALAALGAGPGQEVLVPGFFWVSCVNAIIQMGAIPVLVDSDDTLNLCPKDLERKITPKSTVVLVVHMCGASARIDEIVSISRKHNLKVLEDCAQATGGTYKGKFLGTFGDIGTYSFQVNKILSAGEGGMIVTSDPKLFQRVHALHDTGASWRKVLPDSAGVPEVFGWGRGARMGEITAAVLREQVRKGPKVLESMRKSKAAIKAGLKNLKEIAFREVLDPEGDASPFLLTFYNSNGRALQVSKNLSDAGYKSIPLSDYGMHIYHLCPMLVQKLSNSPDGHPWTHPLNQKLVRNYDKGTLPKLDDLVARGVLSFVPSGMNDGHVKKIIELFHSAVGQT